MRILYRTALILILPLAFAGESLSVPDMEYQGKFDSSNVLVVVEANNGWGNQLIAGLSCDGHLLIVGAYSDTTAIRATISPSLTLKLTSFRA